MHASLSQVAGFDRGVECLGVYPAKMTAALVLSLVLHVFGYLWWGGHIETLSPPVDEPLPPRAPVRVALMTARSAATVAPVSSASPAVVSKPVQRAIARAQPVPKPKPLRASPRRSEVPRVPSTPAPLVQPSAAPATPVATAPVAAPASVVGPSADALRERYLHALFAHIERFKFYPAAARRQGMEAAIRVGFLLDRSGAIRDLTIEGGSKLLRHAAEETLSRAAPLPQLPPDIAAPLHVDYRMSFTLR
ncbi:MAG: TonB family protein [Gammaproteobacteria bacterium]|nr:TonB family protein [Gammaproteobacteria bacterium]